MGWPSTPSMRSLRLNRPYRPHMSAELSLQRAVLDQPVHARAEEAHRAPPRLRAVKKLRGPGRDHVGVAGGPRQRVAALHRGEVRVADLDRHRAPGEVLLLEPLGGLARETAEWLEKKHLAGRTVTIKVRYADFTTVKRSHTLSRPTCDADVISSWAAELLHRTQAGRRPVRLLGARVNGLVEHSAL